MNTFLKYLVLAAVAVGIGYAGGFAYHKFEASRIEEKFYWGQWEMDESTDVSPRAYVISSTSHDFGQLTENDIATHDFVIENKGESELEIWIEEPPPEAVFVDLDRNKQLIRPGFTFPVTVTVNVDKLESALTQTIVVVTNDKQNKQIELTVQASKAD